MATRSARRFFQSAVAAGLVAGFACARIEVPFRGPGGPPSGPAERRAAERLRSFLAGPGPTPPAAWIAEQRRALSPLPGLGPEWDATYAALVARVERRALELTRPAAPPTAWWVAAARAELGRADDGAIELPPVFPAAVEDGGAFPLARYPEGVTWLAALDRRDDPRAAGCALIGAVAARGSPHTAARGAIGAGATCRALGLAIALAYAPRVARPHLDALSARAAAAALCLIAGEPTEHGEDLLDALALAALEPVVLDLLDEDPARRAHALDAALALGPLPAARLAVEW